MTRILNPAAPPNKGEEGIEIVRGREWCGLFHKEQIREYEGALGREGLPKDSRQEILRLVHETRAFCQEK